MARSTTTQTRREYIRVGSCEPPEFCRAKPVQSAASHITDLLKSRLHPCLTGSANLAARPFTEIVGIVTLCPGCVKTLDHLLV
jgi:hypothetical protein